MEIIGTIVAIIVGAVGLAAGVAQVASYIEGRKRLKAADPEGEANYGARELEGWDASAPGLETADPEPLQLQGRAAAADSADSEEQRRRIAHILRDVGEGDRAAALSIWQRHVRRRLLFPFQAKVNCSAGDTTATPEEIVMVRRVMGVDEADGVIVQVIRGDVPFDLPLSALSALNKDWPNHQIIDDYRTWLAGNPPGESNDGN